MQLKERHAKRLILGFWGSWSLLVFGSNLADGLAHVGILPAGIPFRSGNLAAIGSVIGVYSFPTALAGLMFVGVVAWDAANGFLFWRAAVSGKRGSSPNRSHVNAAFVVALGLWTSLMLADEFFLSFKVGQFEGTHRSILIALMVSYLLIQKTDKDG